MIDEKSLLNLEFNKILSLISDYAFSVVGKNKIYNLKPYEDYNEALNSLNLTEQVLVLINKYNIRFSFNSEDINSLIEKAKKRILLSIEELYSIYQYLILSNRINKIILDVADDNLDLIKKLGSEIIPFSALENDLRHALRNEQELNDDATDELFNIRHSIIKVKNKINNSLKKYITDGDNNKYLQDNIISVRENRFVIPVKSEYKNQIKGIIHDQSASGATFFIEPIEVIELNNELRSLEIDETIEINKILTSFTNNIDNQSEDIIKSYDKLIEFEIINAKALFSLGNNCYKPILNNDGIIEIINGRHPLIDEKTAIKNSMQLGKSYNILLISGPNAGGKTVTMKMVGLLSLMAMSGIYVTCYENSKFSFFNKIYSDIGDLQSIENNLSTFSSHILNLTYIINNSDSKSLILLDELGGGTEPSEGAALAISVMEYLVKIKSRAIITTHYNSIKAYAINNKYIENASLDFDYDNMQPTYKLLLGAAGSSNALKIARKYGIANEIYENALKFLNEENIKFEQALVLTEKKNRELSVEISNYHEKNLAMQAKIIELDQKNEILNRKLEDINNNAQIKAKKIIQNYIDNADDIIIEMKELLKSKDEYNIVKLNHLKKELNNLTPDVENDNNKLKYDFIEGSINEGDTVFIDSLNDIGKVVKINGNKVELNVGQMQLYSKLDDLHKVIVQQDKKDKKVRSIELNIQSISNEINIIGKTTDEVDYLLTPFIDNAITNGLKEIRIVHGKGTFKLRDAVWDYLKKQRCIAEFRSGRYGEGELGVTIAKLK